MKSCCPSGAGVTVMFGGRCNEGSARTNALWTFERDELAAKFASTWMTLSRSVRVISGDVGVERKIAKSLR